MANSKSGTSAPVKTIKRTYKRTVANVKRARFSDFTENINGLVEECTDALCEQFKGE